MNDFQTRVAIFPGEWTSQGESQGIERWAWRGGPFRMGGPTASQRVKIVTSGAGHYRQTGAPRGNDCGGPPLVTFYFSVVTRQSLKDQNATQTHLSKFFLKKFLQILLLKCLKNVKNILENSFVMQKKLFLFLLFYILHFLLYHILHSLLFYILHFLLFYILLFLFYILHF